MIRSIILAVAMISCVPSLAEEPPLLRKKAEHMARLGKLGHLSRGWLPGAKCEGVGRSSRSAASAVRNCCYYGQRKGIACPVSRGRRGYWYAVCQYR